MAAPEKQKEQESVAPWTGPGRGAAALFPPTRWGVGCRGAAF